MKSRCLGIALVGFGLAAACDGRPRPTPTGPGAAQLPPPSPPLPPQPTEPRQSQAFEISGVVTDNVGTPVAAAKMTVLLDTYDIGAVVVTSPSGHYRVNFSAVHGSNYYPERDASGTRDSIAFLEVEAQGFERFVRHVLGTAPQLVENVRLHRIRRIDAGESLNADRLARRLGVRDGWLAGPEQVCGIVRVLAARDGVLRVEAIPTRAGSARPDLTVYGGNTGAPRANPTSLRVIAGTEYFVNVPVEWGLPENRDFSLETSLTGR